MIITPHRPLIDGVPVPLDAVVTYNPTRYHLADRNGEWDTVDERNVVRRLRELGISQKIARGSDVSPLEECLLAYQRHNKAHSFGKLSGHKAGLYEMASQRFLVLDGAKPTVATKGEWPTLAEYLNQLLGPVQLPHFLGWLQQGRRSIFGTTVLPGQVVVLSGKHGIGKSFLQSHIITVMFGGRQADPFDYMSGVTDFNGELFGADHLAVEDKFFKSDMDTRRKFGARLKELAVNHFQRCHTKGQTALFLQPKWRVSISLNPDRENLNVLPPLDESVKDKLMMFSCHAPTCLPAADKWGEWAGRIAAELPAFAEHVDNHEVPLALRHARYGVAEYHCPTLLESVEDNSTESLFLSCAMHDLPAVVEVGATVWTGGSADLERLLLGAAMPSRDISRKLLSWPGAAGTHLGRLARQFPKIVSRKRINGLSLWTLTLENPNSTASSQD